MLDFSKFGTKEVSLVAVIDNMNLGVFVPDNFEEPVGESVKMSEGSLGPSVGDNLARSYLDLGSCAGKGCADLGR